MRRMVVHKQDTPGWTTLGGPHWMEWRVPSWRVQSCCDRMTVILSTSFVHRNAMLILVTVDHKVAPAAAAAAAAELPPAAAALELAAAALPAYMH